MVATAVNAALAVNPEGPPKYQKLRYEEDYRYLQDPSKRIDWFDPIKYVPLSEDGEYSLSLGGLIRERYEYIHNPLWGQDPHGAWASAVGGLEDRRSCGPARAQ